MYSTEMKDGKKQARMSYLLFEFEITAKAERLFSGRDMQLCINSATKVCRLHREALRWNKAVASDVKQAKILLENNGVKFSF